MQPTHDPYISIRDEISSEIQHITTLEARLFSGRPEAKHQLKQSFQDVQEQLSALETAVRSMVDNPAKFDLDPTTALLRQGEVETLRFQLDELQRTCSSIQVSSSHSTKEVEMHSAARINELASQQHSMKSPPAMGHNKLAQQQQHSSGSSSTAPKQLPQAPAAPAPSTRANVRPFTSTKAEAAGWSQYDDDVSRGWDQYEDVVQQQVMQQQDEALEHISIHVDRIKQQGHLMHDELEEQALLLDGLGDDTDASQLRLHGLRKKVADVMQQSRHDRQLCLILALSVLLVILTVVALA